jgi:hypothetical protein
MASQRSGVRSPSTPFDMTNDDTALLVAAQLEGRALRIDAWHGRRRCFSKWLILARGYKEPEWFFIDNDRCAVRTLKSDRPYTKRVCLYTTRFPHDRKRWSQW